MPGADLINAEWNLSYPGTSLTFGTAATPVWNITTPDLGDVELRLGDVERPRADGRAMAVDYRNGRTVTFDLGVRAASEAAVRSEAARLAAAWRADSIRKQAGALAELTARYRGIERVMYGRPRKYAEITSNAGINRIITATATFDTIDDVFYDAVEYDVPINLVPSSSGGLLAPLSSPLGTTFESDRSVGITVETELPAWPIIEITGPITNPGFSIVGVLDFSINGTIAHDETVTIDTRPWSRSVLRSGGGSLAGAFTRSSTRLSDAGMPAGSYEVALRGQDVTGTASARLRWRGTYPTL